MITELLSEKQSLWEGLKQADKPIFIYGMGDGALKIMSVLERENIHYDGIYASNEFVRGHSFCGHVVKRLDEVKATYGKNFITLLAFATFREEMLEVLYGLQDMCEFYAPDVPVVKVDDQLFDLNYINRYDKEFTQVYEMLSDDWSKKVFLDTLNFKVSGKISYLKEITTPINEVYETIIQPKPNDVYIDLGAYNGDTISEYLQYAKGDMKRIIALEPDIKNLTRLQKRVEDEQIKNVEAHHMGAWDCEDVLHFASRGGRNSMLDQKGMVQVAANSVDNLLQGQEATTINLDVEGAETKALWGSKQTIQAYHPNLMISAYHKNEDLFALPLLVKSFYPHYKLYLRHHPYIPAWETNYYMIAE